MDEHQWVKCPVCGNKTRLMIRPDTEIKHLPLYCPKCSTETLIDIKKLHLLIVTEPDA